MFRIISLILLLALTACQPGADLQQQRLIREYLSNVSQILTRHSQALASASEMPKIRQQQHNTIDNFTKLQQHYQAYADLKQLQLVIHFYHQGLQQLFIRNAQLLALSDVFQSELPDLLAIAGDDQLYQQQQIKLSQLLMMTDEFSNLILNHHENMRRELVASELSQELRQMVWPDLDFAISRYLSRMNKDIWALKRLAPHFQTLLEFLHQHPPQPQGEQGKLGFATPVESYEFQKMLSALQYEQQDIQRNYAR